MDKTISITISGLIFHVEEAGYVQLDAWLSEVRRHFSKYDDSDDIQQDIENRIAEIFSERTSDNKRVVATIDVIEVIKQIGTIQDFEHFEKDDEGGSTQESTIRKRLYRDPDNSVLGGVAAGVAAYFGIDIILTRILFIIFALIWGVSILIYIVLWIVMPVADTPAKKLEMKGEPVTLSGLEQRIKDSVPPKHEIKSATGRFLNRCTEVLRDLGEMIILFIRKTGPVLLTIIGAILVLAGSIAVILLTILLLLLLTDTTAAWFGVTLSQFASTPMMHYVLLICTYLLLAIPSVLIVMAGIALTRSHKKTGSSHSPVVLLSAWVIILIATTITGLREIPVYQENFTTYISNLELQERIYDLDDYHSLSISGGHEVNIVPSEDHYVKVVGDEQVLNHQLDLRVTASELIVNNSRACIFCSPRPARLEIGITQPRELRLSGATNTTLDGFLLDKLSLRISGSSRFVSSSEIIDLSTSISGASRASFTGDVTRAEVVITHSSHFTITEPLETLKVTASRASRVETGEVMNFIEADLSHASVLQFIGSPELSDIRASSDSRVIAR